MKIQSLSSQQPVNQNLQFVGTWTLRHNFISLLSISRNEQPQTHYISLNKISSLITFGSSAGPTALWQRILHATVGLLLAHWHTGEQIVVREEETRNNEANSWTLETTMQLSGNRSHKYSYLRCLEKLNEMQRWA